MLRALAIALIFAFSLAAQEDSAEKIPKENPYTTPADLARGQHLFFGHCAPCHGPRAEGGKGPTLARPKLLRAPDDQALFKTIKNGIEGTEMPGAWEMIDKEIWQTALFVRSLGQVPLENVPGDPQRGGELFLGKGKCTQCHTVAGRGGRLGPELTEIGARRSSAYLRRALLEPEAEVPDGFLQVRVATRDGRRFTGVRLSEDTYSLQMLDTSDRLHSFWKADLSELHKDWKKSPMPAYRGVFSDAELDDIIAYLVSLRGRS
ncbi:MAG TPA: c-type cytochrome [Bryobacterales bacterium]|nr:c-type cytochrome [Bryobacterales bacterium]